MHARAREGENKSRFCLLAGGVEQEGSAGEMQRQGLHASCYANPHAPLKEGVFGGGASRLLLCDFSCSLEELITSRLKGARIHTVLTEEHTHKMVWAERSTDSHKTAKTVVATRKIQTNWCGLKGAYTQNEVP